MAEAVLRADRVQPADEAAEPAPDLGVVELGRAPGPALADAEAIGMAADRGDAERRAGEA